MEQEETIYRECALECQRCQWRGRHQVKLNLRPFGIGAGRYQIDPTNQCPRCSAQRTLKPPYDKE